MPLSLVEGWTYAVDYILQANGLAIDLTGVTTTCLSLDLLDRNDNPSTSTGVITIIDSTSGKVRFTPGSTGDFRDELSPYRLRYALSTGGGISYYPNGTAEVITVRI